MKEEFWRKIQTVTSTNLSHLRIIEVNISNKYIKRVSIS